MENYVAYHHSKIGWLKLTASETEVAKIEFINQQGANKINQVLKTFMIELDKYFNFETYDFNKVNFAPQGTVLQSEIYQALAKTQRGELISYSELAHRASTNAIRVVASTMARNNYPIVIPCHRVINKDGTWGKFAGGEGTKEKLILHEFEWNFRQLCVDTYVIKNGNNETINFTKYNDFYSYMISQIIKQTNNNQTRKIIELKLYAMFNYKISPKKNSNAHTKDFYNIGISDLTIALIKNFTKDFLDNQEFYQDIKNKNFTEIKMHLKQVPNIEQTTIEQCYIKYFFDQEALKTDNFNFESYIARLIGNK